MPAPQSWNSRSATDLLLSIQPSPRAPLQTVYIAKPRPNDESFTVTMNYETPGALVVGNRVKGPDILDSSIIVEDTWKHIHLLTGTRGDNYCADLSTTLTNRGPRHLMWFNFCSQARELQQTSVDIRKRLLVAHAPRIGLLTAKDTNSAALQLTGPIRTRPTVADLRSIGIGEPRRGWNVSSSSTMTSLNTRRALPEPMPFIRIQPIRPLNHMDLEVSLSPRDSQFWTSGSGASEATAPAVGYRAARRERAAITRSIEEYTRNIRAMAQTLGITPSLVYTHNEVSFADRNDVPIDPSKHKNKTPNIINMDQVESFVRDAWNRLVSSVYAAPVIANWDRSLLEEKFDTIQKSYAKSMAASCPRDTVVRRDGVFYTKVGREYPKPTALLDLPKWVEDAHARGDYLVTIDLGSCNIRLHSDSDIERHLKKGFDHTVGRLFCALMWMIQNGHNKDWTRTKFEDALKHWQVWLREQVKVEAQNRATALIKWWSPIQVGPKTMALVRITTEEELTLEGQLMDHCLGARAYGSHLKSGHVFLSLRTIEDGVPAQPRLTLDLEPEIQPEVESFPIPSIVAVTYVGRDIHARRNMNSAKWYPWLDAIEKLLGLPSEALRARYRVTTQQEEAD